MKKVLNLLFVLVIVILNFTPFNNVKAVSSYSVEMVTSSSNNKVIGTYGSYSAALNVMNSQNSSNSSVATIYRDGIPVDAKYAIFKFKPSGKSTYSLYRNYNSTSEFTSINSSYGIDAAVLGYSDNGRVKIMISGFTGWTDINNGVVTPISLLGGNMININGSGVNLRSDHSTSSSVVASITGSYNFNYTETYKGSDYTWYKISYNGKTCWAAGGYWVTLYDSSLGTYYKHYGPSGNLIHHFTTYGGVSYNDSFTNLGTAPSYMQKDVWYYSFDGNYFYSNLTSMLDDYRSGSYMGSINKDNPHYSYYMYLTSRSTTGYTASDFDNVISSKGYTASTSKMYGTGAYFKEAEEKYGTNALLAFSAALNESNWGTSTIAKNKNNLFGYGAADSCPYDCAYSYNSPRDSIMDYASKSSTSYENYSGKYYNGSHYGNKSSGKNIFYATDPYWGEVMASNAFNRDKSFGGKDFNSNTIGVTKKGVSGVTVYKTPDTNSYFYTMKNPKRSDAVYDFSVNIIDKVTNNGKEFYKIYADDSSDTKYGYVLTNSFYVSNNQPVINASDKTINLGTSFNYMDGVSASDKENGNLTSKVTYTGNVDTNKVGEYKVTYNVVDNSNFRASKTVSVKVIGDAKPTIEASDKEVLQFDSFDYMEGVKAFDSKGDLTASITYEGSVDMNMPGIYEITYKVGNSIGITTKTIKVTVIENEKPVIEANDKNVTLGKEVNLLEGVKATDKEDGDLTSKVIIQSNNVNFNEIGEYKVIYEVSDKHGQKTTKEIKALVKEKSLEKTEGEFYLDYLKEIDGELQIKGYNIIKGIDNDLSADITYELIFKNQNSGEIISESLNRITNVKEMSIPTSSKDKYDYTYSWFKGVIDINKLPEGDYTLYLKSVGPEYYSENLVQNMLLNEQVSQYNTASKHVTITNDYLSNDIPMIFTVRTEAIGIKETAYDVNQYSYIEDISFQGNRAHFKGATYSVDLDMRSTTNLERKIIFENVDTFEKYIYDLGFVSKGTFDINLTVADHFGKKKDKAWFDMNIDISELKKGKYAIYVSNKSNVSDYGELTDVLLYVNLSNAKKVINGKEYRFELNENLRDRIELTVK